MKMTDWEIYQLAKHKPRDAKELDTYCKAIFNMDIPKDRSGYCKRHCRQCDPPFEALKSAYFAETPECGWVGGRGTSKTVMIALLASIELLTLEIDVSIISGSKDQSSLILKYMRNQDTTLRGKLWGAENAPKWLFNEREDAKYRLRTVEDKRSKESIGNEIVAHAAAESSIRGSHPLRARLDECLHFNTRILTSCGTKRVCDLQPEDIVYGWDGQGFIPVPVDRVWCTGIKPTIRFDFEDGTYIEVTGNHPILTDRGWMYAEDLAKTQTALLEMQRRAKANQQAECDRTVCSLLEGGDSKQSSPMPRVQGTNQTREVEGGKSAHAVHGLLPQESVRAEEAVSRVWSRGHARGHHVQRLLREESRSQSQTLHRLWGTTTRGRAAMPEVFPGFHAVGRIPTQTRCWDCETNSREHGSPNAQSSGGRSDRFATQFEHQVCSPASMRAIRPGLLPAEVAYSHRGGDSTAFYSTECGDHDAQGPLPQKKRNPLDHTDHQPKEPLVVGSSTPGCPTFTYKRIVRVSDGPTAPVYDVALRHTHNFIANGIVVHNCDLAEWGHIETSRGLPTEDVTRPDARTHILYASTYHVYNGTMSRLIKELRAKGFPVFSWCVFEQMEDNGGFITRRYLADKMRTMGKIKWDIEYMNNGPIAGVPILDPAMLAHRFDPAYGSVPGLPNIPWELTDTPSKMTRHYHGIDWAKAEHWTVFDTLIRADKGFQQAAWYRTGRKPWPDISRDAARHVHRFLGPVAHDATGVGAAMDDWLVEHRVPRSRISGINWRKTTLIKEMATAYVGALQSGEIVGPDIEFAKSEHEYLTEAMLYDDDHCPDSVAAAMMAYWMARQSNRRTSPRPMRIRT